MTRLMDEAKLERLEARREADRLRAQMPPPVEAISMEELAGLQARFERVHGAGGCWMTTVCLRWRMLSLILWSCRHVLSASPSRRR